ncbi:hypothetical protein FO519_003758 [Halicephalobus sp. NKZ332]|nr:hypothetical protein FO519_003758 [Halicephalobus sp. NKZ332]
MGTHTMSGAEYLASIYGTEKDKVNCSFYFKIGACRHGDKCSRTHNMPTFSQTILLKNLYHNPVIDMRQADAFSKVGQRNDQEQQYFDDFFEELFTEIDTKYGKIEEMNVCDNIGEHMIGNVYIKFYREEDAEKCKNALEDRWFNGEPIYCELSPVTDFREACCRQYELGGCQKENSAGSYMEVEPVHLTAIAVEHAEEDGTVIIDVMIAITDVTDAITTVVTVAVLGNASTAKHFNFRMYPIPA